MIDTNLQEQMTRRRHSTCHLHHISSGVCSDCLRQRLSLLQSPKHSLPIKSKQSTMVLNARVCEDESEDKSTKKTMKEHIDLEFDHPRRKSLWYNKWKPKQFNKNKPGNAEAEGDPIENKSTVEMRRKSCDSGSRVSSFYEQQLKKNPNNVEIGTKYVEKKPTSRRSCDTDSRVLSVFDPPRLNQREKNPCINVEVEADNIVKKPTSRRSCDMDFRVLSVFDPSRVNQCEKKNPIEKNVEKKPTSRRSCDSDLIDEPARASWDGYMIARTIPRLAPMLSVIKNAMVNEQMLMEDFETNSVSESSSSQRRNSFDCSSSGKSSSRHRAPVEIDHVRSVLPVAKIVVNGVVGFDLYKDNSNNTEMGVRNSDSFKRKMMKIMGFRSKSRGLIEVSSGKVVGKKS